MQYNYGQPMPITIQPHVPIALVGNPFRQAQSEWSAGLCNCCDDMGQCEWKANEKNSKKNRTLGMLAYFCWPCFLGSLAGKIKESPISCFCVPNALGVYRMKVRSVLKIRVSLSLSMKCKSIISMIRAMPATTVWWWHSVNFALVYKCAMNWKTTA